METDVCTQLFALQDLSYRDFHRRLMPTVDPARVIGVRMPALRKLAKAMTNTPQATAFLQQLPHFYYEENNLHALLLEPCKDYAQVIVELERFLPYVDNWATCDLLCPKVLGRHLSQLWEPIEKWLNAEHCYTVRFAIGLLMRFYLDDAFDPKCLDMVAGVQFEEYYVNMMIAWYFATALAKQYDAALPYLTQHRLSAWTHNKTIQKAIESYRIDNEKKAYLRTLKRSQN